MGKWRGHGWREGEIDNDRYWEGGHGGGGGDRKGWERQILVGVRKGDMVSGGEKRQILLGVGKGDMGRGRERQILVVVGKARGHGDREGERDTGRCVEVGHGEIGEIDIECVRWWGGGGGERIDRFW